MSSMLGEENDELGVVHAKYAFLVGLRHYCCCRESSIKWNATLSTILPIDDVSSMSD